MIGFLIPVLTWSFKVNQRTGRFEVSSGSMLSVQDGLIHKGGFKFKEYELTEDAQKEISAGRMKRPADLAIFYTQKLLQKPKAVLRYLLFKGLRPWYATDSERHEDRIILIQISYLIFGLWGMAAALRKYRLQTQFFTAIILYFWLTTFSVLSILRYMIPAMGFLIIFAAALISGEMSRKNKTFEENLRPE
jgi:hypothetical protein